MFIKVWMIFSEKLAKQYQSLKLEETD